MGSGLVFAGSGVAHKIELPNHRGIGLLVPFEQRNGHTTLDLLLDFQGGRHGVMLGDLTEITLRFLIQSLTLRGGFFQGISLQGGRLLQFGGHGGEITLTNLVNLVDQLLGRAPQGSSEKQLKQRLNTRNLQNLVL